MSKKIFGICLWYHLSVNAEPSYWVNEMKAACVLNYLLKCVETVRGVDLLEHKHRICSLCHLRHFSPHCEPGAESGVGWIKLAHDRAQ